jgi:hypothetical protein
MLDANEPGEGIYSDEVSIEEFLAESKKRDKKKEKELLVVLTDLEEKEKEKEDRDKRRNRRSLQRKVTSTAPAPADSSDTEPEPGVQTGLWERERERERKRLRKRLFIILLSFQAPPNLVKLALPNLAQNPSLNISKQLKVPLVSLLALTPNQASQREHPFWATSPPDQPQG